MKNTSKNSFFNKNYWNAQLSRITVITEEQTTRTDISKMVWAVFCISQIQQEYGLKPGSLSSCNNFLSNFELIALGPLCVTTEICVEKRMETWTSFNSTCIWLKERVRTKAVDCLTWPPCMDKCMADFVSRSLRNHRFVCKCGFLLARTGVEFKSCLQGFRKKRKNFLNPYF